MLSHGQSVQVASSDTPATTVDNDEGPVHGHNDDQSAVNNMNNEAKGEPETQTTGEIVDKENGKDGESPSENANDIKASVGDFTSKGIVEGTNKAAVAEQGSEGAVMGQLVEGAEDQDGYGVVQDEGQVPSLKVTGEHAEMPTCDLNQASSLENQNGVNRAGVAYGEDEESEFESIFATIDHSNLENETRVTDPDDPAFWKGVREDFDAQDAARSPPPDSDLFTSPLASTVAAVPPIWNPELLSWPVNHDPVLTDELLATDIDGVDEALDIYLTAPAEPPAQLASTRHVPGTTSQFFNEFDEFQIGNDLLRDSFGPGIPPYEDDATGLGFGDGKRALDKSFEVDECDERPTKGLKLNDGAH